jgi:hypothetical protein
MKCPKCGYISFDNNQVCPKCNKDISQERDRLNLPDFHPQLPFLLTSLTGEAAEASLDIDIESPERALPPLEETGGLEAEEPASLDQESDLEPTEEDQAEDLEPSPITGLEEGLEVEESEEEEQEISFEFEEIDSAPDALQDDGLADIDDIPLSEPQDVLDLGDLELGEAPEPLAGPTEQKAPAEDSDTVTVDLEELSSEEGQTLSPGDSDEVDDLELDLDELELDLELDEEDEDQGHKD